MRPRPAPGALAVCCLGALLAVPARGDERPTREVPVLSRAPRVDGALADLAAGLPLRAKAGEAGPALRGRVAVHGSTVYVGAELADREAAPGDVLEVVLHFPGAGLTARGSVYRFGRKGALEDGGEFAAPPHARAKVRAAVRGIRRGVTFELAIPAEALPPFPARGPLVADLCLRYEDAVGGEGPPQRSSSCDGAAMGGFALRLPAPLRDRLGLRPPASVEALEGGPGGWRGLGQGLLPVWLSGASPLAARTVADLATERPLDPGAVGLHLPHPLSLGPRVFVPVLAGEDPFAQGGCDPLADLRLALYRVVGEQAFRVLEWPAASCGLGRAVVVSVDEEDASLTIGYTTGHTVRFGWSDGEFQRIELGRR